MVDQLFAVVGRIERLKGVLSTGQAVLEVLIAKDEAARLLRHLLLRRAGDRRQAEQVPAAVRRRLAVMLPLILEVDAKVLPRQPQLLLFRFANRASELGGWRSRIE